MASSRLEFRILGPLVVRVDSVAIPAAGPKQRALLALLLLSANRVVSRDRVIDALWGENAPDAAVHNVQVYVSRLRKMLGPATADGPRIVARAPGYLLRVEPGELDLEMFEHLVADGREQRASGDLAGAARSFREGEALWQGRPLADLEFEPFARIDVDRLEEQRLAAVEECVDAELALGRHLALVPELETLTAEHPLRERFHAQLMLALYRSGRQAEGLDVYRRTRRLLDEQLGLAPSIELQELERSILSQDRALEVSAEEHAVEPPRPEEELCPFKGLAPFEQADAEFFFGREQLVQELAARFTDAPLLAIVGASGSGKSSLVRAGLLPALAAGALPGSERWPRLLLRPGERPLAALERAAGGALADAVERVAPGKRVVVVVDQFEEVFAASVAENERRAFVDELVEAAWDPGRRAVVLLAIRADLFARIAGYPALADLAAANQVLLGPMTSGELRRAVEGPAVRVGLIVEPELVDALVDDVTGEEGGLPLLSTALLDLWVARENRTLTLAAYERMGGISGAVGRHAEQAFRSLDPHSRDLAREVLVRLAAGGAGAPLTRRAATRVELGADEDERVAGILDTLVAQRLLVARDDAVELVHEALLERWPRLAAWLEEDEQGRRLRQHLGATAADWERGGRDPGELYRGARLAAVLEWRERRPREARLGRLEREFLEESQAASARDSERQRRANRRLRAALAGVLALLALAAAAGLVALRERGHAREEATTAIAQRLGAQALIQPSLDRSLLLAREAVRLDDSVTTEGNLLAALLRSPAALGMAHATGNRALDEALSPDGSTLAVRGDDGAVTFFDTQTLRPVGASYESGDQIGLMGAIVGPLHALAFSPHGGRLAVGSTNGSGALLDLVGAHSHLGEALRRDWPLHVADVAYAPDGKTIAVGEPGDGRSTPPAAVIELHDAQTNALGRSSALLPGGRLLGYTSDGRSLLVAEGARRSVLLDARTLHVTARVPVGGIGAVSPVRQEAAFGGGDGSLSLVDLRTGHARRLPGRAGAAVDSVTFSRDASLVATAAADGSVAVWSVTSGLQETFEAHSASAVAVVFSPDARTLYSAGADGAVLAWDVTGVRRLGQTFRASSAEGGSSAVAASPDGTRFATSAGDSRVTLWNAQTLTRARELRAPLRHVNALAFGAGGLLVAASGDGGAAVWSVADGELRRAFRMDGVGGLTLAFSRDGRRLALVDQQGGCVVRNVRTGAVVARFSAAVSLSDVDFSPDGTLVVAAGLDGGVRVWDVAARAQVALLTGPASAFSVAFSPDGKLIAVGDGSGAVEFWSAAAWRRDGRALSGNNGGVTDVAFDAGGRTLVTSSDGRLRLWNVASRRLIGAPLPGSDSGGSVAFVAGGTRVVGTFGSGAGVLWNVNPVSWAARACGVARRTLTPDEWRDFLPERPYGRVCS